VGIAVFVALALVAFVWFFNNGGLNLGTATEGTASVADTTQTAPAATPTDDATQQEAAATTPANTDDAAAAPASADIAPGDGQYTGELAFLGTLVPQMHIDIDKLYARGGGREAIHRRVVTYYKGLRGTLKNMSQAQYDAFDKAFGDYIKQKNAE
jgi:serine/threonine-protein kinase